MTTEQQGKKLKKLKDSREKNWKITELTNWKINYITV